MATLVSCIIILLVNAATPYAIQELACSSYLLPLRFCSHFNTISSYLNAQSANLPAAVNQCRICILIPCVTPTSI